MIGDGGTVDAYGVHSVELATDALLLIVTDIPKRDLTNTIRCDILQLC